MRMRTVFLSLFLVAAVSAFQTASAQPCGKEVCGDGVDNDCDGIVDECCGYTWSEFVAGAADTQGLPSDYANPDSRAGSVEFNYNGDIGMGGAGQDPAFSAGILAMRNGAGQVLEQFQINRAYPAGNLDGDGCVIGADPPQCWLYPDGAGLVVASTPTYVADSNEDFDASGARVIVSGQSIFDLSGGPFEDNGHEVMIAMWNAPNGLDTAQIELRGRFDWDGDGLNGSDPFVPLFRNNYPSGDVLLDCVEVLEMSDTAITVRLNAQDALDCVHDAYVDLDLCPYCTDEVCNGEDDDCDGEIDEGCDFTWSEFIATSAEIVGFPSAFRSYDTRAGSLEMNFNGGAGFDSPWRDPAFRAGILTMRNGAGQVIEQAQLNRRWPPHNLDANGCSTSSSFIQCWLSVAADMALDAFLPMYATSSNDGFDASGERVEVSGAATIGATPAGAVDNSHETVSFTWTAPNGMDTAQAELRLRYDASLDGLNHNDPFLPLFQWNVPAVGDELLNPAVTVVSSSDTEITIIINVQDALDEVHAFYRDQHLF